MTYQAIIDQQNNMKFTAMRIVTVALVFVLAPTMASRAQRAGGTAFGQWRHYSGDRWSTKYSPLDQINRSNVDDLEEVWRWKANDTHPPKVRRDSGFKATPLVVDGVMYVSTAYSLVAAINPGTGETLWVYDPESYKKGRPANTGFQHRGLEYWTGGKTKRIFIATGGRQLVSIDTETGKADPKFGENGIVNLERGLGRVFNPRQIGYSAPPIVCRDTIVLGSIISDGTSTKTQPPGHIRGFDVRTGRQKWIFHTIPQKGEFGNETWLNDSWKYAGGTNAWSMLSADEELGYVYLPIGTPTSDFYGEFRHGDTLFAESLLCLNAETGERVWHFQMVHHGLWDYDPPAAPNLVDIVVDGKRIKAVAQVTKHAFVFVFDRVTGKPIWPIEERPVPQSTTPGERTSPTQPHPTKPPAYDRQGITEDDLIDFTPELRKEALRILSEYTYGPLFTPPSVVTETNKGTALLPHINGGSNWGGACVDPETAIMYVPSQTRVFSMGVRMDTGGRTEFRYVPKLSSIPGPQGLPLTKPPYGRITAIDLNRGEFVWQVPLGDGPRDHPAIKHLHLGPLGSPTNSYGLAYGGGVVTKELLFMIQPNVNPVNLKREDHGVIRAFDKTDGDKLWEYQFDKIPQGTPMTYMHKGRQYVVVAIGGSRQPAELVALRLKS